MLSNRRHRLAFSLRTLFIAIAICGTIGYWGVQKAKVHFAEVALSQATAEWEAELISTQELCESSKRLLTAELSVPFGNCSQASDEHLTRIKRIKERTDAMKHALWGDLNEYSSLKADIDAYYDEAMKLQAAN